MSRIWAVVGVLLLGTVSACSSASHHAAPTATTVPAATATTRPVTSTCGDFALTATIGKRVVTLASCGGFVGLTPLPDVAITRGEVVSIGPSLPRLRLVSSASGVVRIAGHRSTGEKRGVATIIATGVFCLPVAHIQPKSCAALTVTVN